MINLAMAIILILIVGQITTIFKYYPYMKAKANYYAYREREYKTTLWRIRLQKSKMDSVKTQIEDWINLYHQEGTGLDPMDKNAVY